jgi:hypothetical protein
MNETAGRRRALHAVAAVALVVAGVVGGAVGIAGATPSSTCTVTHNSDTGNGANTSGAYDANCNGSPSGNGGGNGNAQPCAGCVGNADNKNPPGQAPDGSDNNNGYECDGNKGIALTNPAHTGCSTTTSSTTSMPSGPPS